MRLPRSARLALRALETTIGPWQPVCRRGAARGGARGSLGSRMDPAERGGGPQPCSGGGRGRYRAKAVQMRLPTCHFAKKRKIVFNKADFSLCLGVTFVWGTLTFVKNIFSSTLWSARDLSGQPTQDASHVGISASVPSAQATTAATKDCMLDVILAVFLGFRRFLREFCSRRM